MHNHAHRIAVAIIMFASSLSFLSHATPAEAVVGCKKGNARLLGQGWHIDTLYGDPWAGPIANPVPTPVPMRLSGTIGGYWCKSGKTKFKWIVWCWSFPEGRKGSNAFEGVEFNSNIWDAGQEKTNPPPIYLEDNGKQQNCRTQNFVNSTETWMWQYNRPKRSQQGKIELSQAIPDRTVKFKSGKKGKSNVKYWNPYKAQPLGSWK